MDQLEIKEIAFEVKNCGQPITFGQNCKGKEKKWKRKRKGKEWIEIEKGKWRE